MVRVRYSLSMKFRLPSEQNIREKINMRGIKLAICRKNYPK